MGDPKQLDQIKIIDFGFARRIEKNKPLQIMFGTAEFVAPEVVNYDPLGPGSDVWSIAVITYILLSGLSPFAGDTDAETLSNVTAGEVDFDDECFDLVSEEAKDFMDVMFCMKERDRPSASECLQHEWLANQDEGSEKLGAALENLKKYVARRKWVRSINAVRAVTRLQLGLGKLLKNAKKEKEETKIVPVIDKQALHNASEDALGSTGSSPKTPLTPTSARTSTGDEEGEHNSVVEAPCHHQVVKTTHTVNPRRESLTHTSTVEIKLVPRRVSSTDLNSNSVANGT